LIGKFILFLLLIYGSLFFGYGIKLIFPRAVSLNKPLTKLLFMVFTSFITFNSVWSLKFTNISVSILPVINLIFIIFSLVPAILVSNVVCDTKGEKGSFVACTIFSNWGTTFGGFLAFLFYGKEGLYYANWFIAFCRLYHFFIGFPLLNSYSREKLFNRTEAILFVKNIVYILPLALLFSGLILNFIGIPRPPLIDYIATQWIIYVTIIGYSFTIGLGINIRRSLGYLKKSLFIALIKFVFTPIVALAVIFILRIEDIVTARVILIESFMPTAIMSVVLVKIFNLNEDLANASWFLTTMCIVPLALVMILFRLV
jgi:predicted permease